MANFMIRFLLCNVFISGIVGILLIAKWVFRNNLSSRMQYNLWLLLLGLLAVPFIPFRLISFPQIFSWLSSVRKYWRVNIMWHTAEMVKIFEKMTEGYGYDIYQNRKLCVALCNDLFADYSVEKNIMQMLFRAGLGEAMKGVPFKSERELKMGLSNIEKFLMAQAIESSVRDDVLDVMRLAFVEKGVNSEVKSAYQPVISKNFNDSHFKMTLPVIKEFADRIEASFKFLYVNKGEEVDSVLEKCIITDKFGKMHSSRMDYELLTHDRSRETLSCRRIMGWLQWR